MDEIVVRAMARWPNVPAVFGWLALDRRGRWLLCGERVGNLAANLFISRNYAHDAEGRWYFQNGPQRVYVHLHYTPWVLSVDGSDTLVTHTGLAVSHLKSAWTDDAANLLLDTDRGLGLVHDQDLARLADAFTDAAGNPLDDPAIEHALDGLSAGDPVDLHVAWNEERVRVEFIHSADVSAHFGFDPSPDDPPEA